jgi:preprotein translocase subunit YajC
MLISAAYAQSASGLLTQLSASPLPMLVLIFGVFYFFMIRPQQQKAKQLKTAQAGLRRGDKVITSGGIIGSVARVINDSEVEVEVAENVRLRVVRSTIPTIIAKTEPATADKPVKSRSNKPADGSESGGEA